MLWQTRVLRRPLISRRLPAVACLLHKAAPQRLAAGRRYATLQALLDTARAPELHHLEGDAFDASLSAAFAFAYVWALGGCLASAAAREGFDEFAREELANVARFPGKHGRAAARAKKRLPALCCLLSLPRQRTRHPPRYH